MAHSDDGVTPGSGTEDVADIGDGVAQIVALFVGGEVVANCTASPGRPSFEEFFQDLDGCTEAIVKFLSRDHSWHGTSRFEYKAIITNDGFRFFFFGSGMLWSATDNIVLNSDGIRSPTQPSARSASMVPTTATTALSCKNLSLWRKYVTRK